MRFKPRRSACAAAHSCARTRLQLPTPTAGFARPPYLPVSCPLLPRSPMHPVPRLTGGPAPFQFARYSLSVNTALISSWVRQRSPACCAASTAGAWNAVMLGTRSAPGAPRSPRTPRGSTHCSRGPTLGERGRRVRQCVRTLSRCRCSFDPLSPIATMPVVRLNPLCPLLPAVCPPAGAKSQDDVAAILAGILEEQISAQRRRLERRDNPEAAGRRCAALRHCTLPLHFATVLLSALALPCSQP